MSCPRLVGRRSPPRPRAGGTSQIQRTIIGERIPGPARGTGRRIVTSGANAAVSGWRPLRSAGQTRSMMVAVPMPPPVHMVTRPVDRS